MRKLKIMFLAVFTFMFATSKVGAASNCDVSEAANLNMEVVNIKASYEEAEGTLDPEMYLPPEEVLGTEEEENYVGTYDYFKISIINLTENFYIEVTNDFDSDKKIFNYSDSKDGVITFDWKELYQVTNFTIKVYASDKTGCKGESYRTIYLTTPRLNENYNYSICNGAPEYYLCQKYVSYDPVSFGDFFDKVSNYIDQKNEKEKETNEEKEGWLTKTGNFIKEHKAIFIVGGIAIVVIAGVVTIVVVKRNRRRII